MFGLTRHFGSSALACALACIFFAGCGSNSDDNGGLGAGAGRVPTTSELGGYWSWTDAETGVVTVWQFSATPQSDWTELAGKSNVYVAWQTNPGLPEMQIQRGTFAIANGQLQTTLTWDRFFPCLESDELCMSQVGTTFGNTILAFRDDAITFSSVNTDSGKRVMTRTTGCPTPVSTSRWILSGGPLASPDYGEVNFTQVAAPPSGPVQLVAGSGSTHGLRRAVRQACGWRTDFIDNDATDSSEIAFDAAGKLHAAYWQRGLFKTGYAVSNGNGFDTQDLDSLRQPLMALDGQGDVHLVVAKPETQQMSYGKLTGGKWMWEDVAIGTGSGITLAGISVRLDGAVVLLYRDSGTWKRATRTPAGVWKLAPEPVDCETLTSVRTAKDGSLRALCGRRVVDAGNVQKWSDVYSLTENGGQWQAEHLGMAVRTDLTLDASDAPHVAMLVEGNAGQTKGQTLMYGAKVGGAWQFDLVGDGDMNAEMWHDVRLALDADGKAHIHMLNGRYGTNAVQAGNATAPLTLTVNNAAPVHVTSIPAGLDCQAGCVASLPQNTWVRLLIDTPHAAVVSASGGPCWRRDGVDSSRWECRAMLDTVARSVAIAVTPSPVDWIALGGSAADDMLEDLSIGADGKLAVVGKTGAAGSLGGKAMADAGADALWLAQLAADGSAHWTAVWAATRLTDSVRKVAATADGGLTAGLTTTQPVALQGQSLAAGAILLHVDANGKLLWSRNAVQGGGGELTGLAVGPNGATLVALRVPANGDVGLGPMATAGGVDGVVALVDAGGKSVWATAVGGTGDEGKVWLDATDAGTAVALVLVSDNPRLAGVDVSADVAPFATLAFGLDASGKPIWHFPLDINGVGAFAHTHDGIVASTTLGINFIHRFDTAGKLVWSKQGADPVRVDGLAELPDGRIAVAGHGTFTPGPVDRGFIQLTGTTGNGLTAGLNPDSYVWPHFVRATPAGGIIWGGEADSGVSFGALTQSGLGGKDGWLVAWPGPSAP